jgi:hypothetical protein
MRIFLLLLCETILRLRGVRWTLISIQFNVRICRYACELLLCFLQDNKFMHLLSIINQYVNLKGSASMPPLIH